jgi:hypothetical protein
VRPQLLPPNVLPHFYAGGGRIAADPEAWLGELPFARGTAVLVPYASGSGELRGRVEALRARPADPGSGDGEW